MKTKPFNQHVPTSLQHHPSTQDLQPLLREQEQFFCPESDYIIISHTLPSAGQNLNIQQKKKSLK